MHFTLTKRPFVRLLAPACLLPACTASVYGADQVAVIC